MKYLKLFYCILFLSFAFGLKSYSQQVSDAFQVKVFESYTQVISPAKMHSEQSIVITNNTSVHVTGQVVDQSKDVLSFVSIRPGRFQVIEVNTNHHTELYFVPLSPGLQEVELIVGRQSYEIPPQNKN